MKHTLEQLREKLEAHPRIVVRRCYELMGLRPNAVNHLIECKRLHADLDAMREVEEYIKEKEILSEYTKNLYEVLHTRRLFADVYANTVEDAPLVIERIAETVTATADKRLLAAVLTLAENKTNE